MSLDPAASPWPGVIASVAVCVWITALGAPLAAAAFRHRPRLVWPFYAPILGAVTVLLVTNLAAYVIPGAPAAWFGLIAPSVAAAVVAWRLGAPRRPSRRSALILLALVLLGVGVFLLAFTNRAHSPFADESWHYPLALRLANGAFPPEPPYGVDAGIGYHYGTNLLAASIFSTTSAPPWAVFDTLLPFLVVALTLVAAGFAYDVGAPLPLALGAGAAATVGPAAMLLGLPPYVPVPAEVTGFEGFLAGLGVRNSADTGPSWSWIIGTHRHFAVAVVFLVAAALEAGVARRPAAVLAAGAGVLALTETSVMLFACGALALVGAARLVRLRGRKRYMLAAALGVSALLVVLAGGIPRPAHSRRSCVRLAWPSAMVAGSRVRRARRRRAPGGNGASFGTAAGGGSGGLGAGRGHGDASRQRGPGIGGRRARRSAARAQPSLPWRTRRSAPSLPLTATSTTGSRGRCSADARLLTPYPADRRLTRGRLRADLRR